VKAEAADSFHLSLVCIDGSCQAEYYNLVSKLLF
jgi:hypothetical protein